MNNKNLIEANKIDKEIKELESFIHRAESVWKGKLIKQNTGYIFKSVAYGLYSEAEYSMNTGIKNKVLEVLRGHLQDLKNQLEAM